MVVEKEGFGAFKNINVIVLVIIPCIRRMFIEILIK